MAQHTFEPETFHNTFGSHSPVLHVEPGDTITTTTIIKFDIKTNIN